MATQKQIDRFNKDIALLANEINAKYGNESNVFTIECEIEDRDVVIVENGNIRYNPIIMALDNCMPEFGYKLYQLSKRYRRLI